nr:Gag-Pol polyprotein [Tanacetum cinerariifolium]
QRSSKPELQSMTSGQIISELDLTYASSTKTKQQPTEGELDLLFEAMYDDYFGGQPSANVENVPPAQEPQVRQTSTASIIIADNVPIPTNSFSHVTNIPITSQDVDELNPNAMIDEQVIGEPSRPVLTKNQLRSDGDMCMYALTVSTMELKNVKEAMIDPAWIESMQEELLQFKRKDNNFFKGTIDPTLFIRRFHNDILVAKPTEKHLKEVKRIFRYLWETVNTDSFKSTSGGAQFLAEKL